MHCKKLFFIVIVIAAMMHATLAPAAVIPDQKQSIPDDSNELKTAHYRFLNCLEHTKAIFQEHVQEH